MTTMTSRPWWHFAACDGTDLRLWFGHDGETLEQQAVREADALAICSRCPVMLPCRQDALSRDSFYGVAGGMTPDERRPARHAMLKRQQRAEGRAA